MSSFRLWLQSSENFRQLLAWGRRLNKLGRPPAALTSCDCWTTVSQRGYSEGCEEECDSEKPPKKIKNLGLVLRCVKELEIEKIPSKRLCPSEVIIKIDCVGISNSDVNLWRRGKIGPYILKEPMVLGHEASGVVFKVGKEVKSVNIGDRVALEAEFPCRKCPLCLSGKYNLCQSIRTPGTPPTNGVMMQYFQAPADNCHKLPDFVTMEEGALVATVAAGMAACRRANIRVGNVVLIMGAGPIGLATLLAAQQMGASKIIMTDVKEFRLKKAKEYGATDTCFTCPNHPAEDNLRKIMEKNSDKLPDKTIDCVGTPESAALGINATSPGGTFTIVGCSDKSPPIPLSLIQSREVDIKGVSGCRGDFPIALALVASQRWNLKQFVTHHFEFTEAKNAFKCVRKRPTDLIKAIVHLQPRNKNNESPF